MNFIVPIFIMASIAKTVVATGASSGLVGQSHSNIPSNHNDSDLNYLGLRAHQAASCAAAAVQVHPRCQGH